MQPVHLFDLAARQAQWASVRQSLIAGNIANANTPGYVARDIEPFSKILDSTHLEMTRTASGHVDTSGTSLETGKIKPEDSWDVSFSGNSVSIDQELIKAGGTERAFQLNASLVKAFHRMFLMSVRSS
ncbi:MULTISPECIES: flagellar basal body rod protein FlgB [Afifella]|uniref:flagellar basal body rod protein FlgB n=1 Tax=Afifella TaxID=643217 RepID=UPI000FE39E32|nr:MULTISPECIES: flagellar basal body rod protein FlgB [Afifella]MCT8267839.1 flagellar basal body rod protein FlgB [Afifella sp. JA880]